MTFTELESRIGASLVQSDWKQYKNGGGWVYKDAFIAESDDIFIGENAVVLRGTIKGGTIEGGTIEGGTIWGGTIKGGTIEGGTWKTNPLYIVGSRHDISNAKPGHIRIGCKCEPFDWWKTKEAERFARDNGYDDEALAEYKEYIKLFARFGK